MRGAPSARSSAANPLKSRILVRRLAVCSSVVPGSQPAWAASQGTPPGAASRGRGLSRCVLYYLVFSGSGLQVV